jgi:hypothetical protein
MTSKLSRMRGALLGLLAGIALTVGAVSTSGIVSFGSQAAASSFPLADGATADADAGAAGTLQVQRIGNRLTIVTLHPASGWTPVIDRQTGREVEVTFTNGTQRIHLGVELDDGQVRVTTSDDRGDRDDDGPGQDVDDDNGHDDDGDDGDRVDDSGPRNGGDDATDDDRTGDNSGPSANAGSANSGGSSDDDDNRGSSGSGSSDDGDDANSGPGNSGGGSDDGPAHDIDDANSGSGNSGGGSDDGAGHDIDDDHGGGNRGSGHGGGED